MYIRTAEGPPRVTEGQNSDVFQPPVIYCLQTTCGGPLHSTLNHVLTIAVQLRVHGLAQSEEVFHTWSAGDRKQVWS